MEIKRGNDLYCEQKVLSFYFEKVNGINRFFVILLSSDDVVVCRCFRKFLLKYAMEHPGSCHEHPRRKP